MPTRRKAKKPRRRANFLRQIELCRREVAKWPAWMREERSAPAWMANYATDL